MKLEQYNSLKNIDLKREKLITIDDLKNKSERTLLYGYTCNRSTWHVYIKNNRIYTVIYEFEKKPREKKVFNNYGYVPDKRLYPETCDFEFCKLLK